MWPPQDTGKFLWLFPGRRVPAHRGMVPFKVSIDECVGLQGRNEKGLSNLQNPEVLLQTGL